MKVRTIKTGIKHACTAAMKRTAVLLLVLSACIPEPLEVDNLPTVQPQIVISSQIISDQTLVVLLTRTIGALDASDDSDPEELLEQISVNDAVVFLDGPAGSDTLPALGDGLYGGLVIPLQDGQQYTLRVKSETLGQVSATTTVQPQVRFENLSASLYYNGFNDTLAQITYSIIDPAPKNWYMLNVQEVEREDFVENLINPRAFTKLLDDDEFQGSAHSEQFRVFPRDYQPGDTIAVTLANISGEYYQFMKLRLDNRFSLVQFLGEPVNYPTNVVGGKGFFNLYVPDVRIFVFE